MIEEPAMTSSYMRNLAVVLAALWLGGCAATRPLPDGGADPAAFGLKGYAIGAQRSAIPGLSGFDCQPGGPEVDLLCSSVEETYAGHALADLTLALIGGQLQRITLTAATAGYADIIAALRRQYGSGVEKTELYSDPAGARLESRTGAWETSQGSIRAIERCTTSEACVSIESREFRRLSAERMAAASASGKADP